MRCMSFSYISSTPKSRPRKPMAGPGLSCEQVMMISLSGVFFAQSMAVLSAFFACSEPS